MNLWQILTTAPHNAVELAALIFCWLATSAAFGLFAYWIIHSMVAGTFGVVVTIALISWAVYDANYNDPPKGSRVQPSQRVTAKPAPPPPRSVDDIIKEGDRVFGVTPPPNRPDY